MSRRKKRGSFLERATEEFDAVPVRIREIVAGSVCVFFGIFLLLAAVGGAGSFGEMVRSALFLRGDGEGALLGWSFVLLILFFFVIGAFLILTFRPLSQQRLWLGSIAGIVSFSVLFAVSVDEVAGGKLGYTIYTILHSFLGFFVYILIPLCVLGSMYLLRLFSPVAIWKWLNEGQDVEEDDDDGFGDEEEDEYDYDDEDGDEESEEDDEGWDDEEGEYEEEDDEGEEETEGEEEEEEMESGKQKKFSKYIAPPLNLLNTERGKGRAENTKAQAQAIKRTLQNFKIVVEVEEVIVGPTFTRYSVRPAEGVRLSKITGLQQNLELALAAHPIRIEAPIPGQSLVGIEVPNSARATVGLRTLLESEEFERLRGALPLAIGKTINGSVFTRSLSKMPHALIAGTTGSGKSVLIHNLILSLLFTYGPKDLRFIFIDPKRVELTLYKGIAHLYTDPITDPKKALQALVWTVNEMERRYELLEEAGARDIGSYNNILGKDDEGEHLPFLVVVIDELADLMQSFPREIEANIVRIAQKSRAVGIHLVISTQRPSVNIITGVVKANVPVRIALQVASSIDSRTILDSTGAENLIGSGDLLFGSAESKKPVRAQSAFVTEEEVKRVTQYILKHNGVAEGLIDVSSQKAGSGGVVGGGGGGDDDDDDLYTEAVDIVVGAQKASTSLLQRKLKIGYSRAARLIDMLEERGIVGPQIGSKPREILTGEDGGGGGAEWDDEGSEGEREE